MGIKTVAVYSADVESLHVRFADEAVCIGLKQLVLFENVKYYCCCRNTNADAIHPGYGFLSENSKFSKNVRNTELNLLELLRK
jgi:acetyl-CoA carboxylase biotin carboxylase subunit